MPDTFEMSTTLKGFDTGIYTLHIGPSHTRLVVPGYILSRIPTISKLIIDGVLVENEPVALEAYDAEAFATVLALVRDGYYGSESEPGRTSQQLIKAYIVAYDLVLDYVQSYLIDQIKTFHLLRIVQPQDFELLYASELPASCEIYVFLLHKMAHDIRTGVLPEVSRTGPSVGPEYFSQMEYLNKVDLIELSHQIAKLSTGWQCDSYHRFSFQTYDQILRQPHIMSKTTGGQSSHNSAGIVVYATTKTDSHLSKDSSDNHQAATQKNDVEAVATSLGKVASAVHELDKRGVEVTPYGKIAQWVDACKNLKRDHTKPSQPDANDSTAVETRPSKETPRDRQERVPTSSKAPLFTLFTSKCASETQKAPLRSNPLSTPRYLPSHLPSRATETTSKTEVTQAVKEPMLSFQFGPYFGQQPSITSASKKQEVDRDQKPKTVQFKDPIKSPLAQPSAERAEKPIESVEQGSSEGTVNEVDNTRVPTSASPKENEDKPETCKDGEIHITEKPTQPRMQDWVVLEDDKESLNELRGEIEGLKKGLGI